jgi:hypothetical protein
MYLKHLQHMQHLPIYFCNVKMQQLQPTSKTIETYIYSIEDRKARRGRFQPLGSESAARERHGHHQPAWLGQVGALACGRIVRFSTLSGCLSSTRP